LSTYNFPSRSTFKIIIIKN